MATSLLSWLASWDCETTAEALREAMAARDERERFILTRHWGLNDTTPMTFAAIGRELGISGGRAGQIEYRALQRIRDFLGKGPAPGLEGLSGRARTVLRNCGIDTPEGLAKLYRRDVVKIKNLGRLTMRELDDWLARHKLTWAAPPFVKQWYLDCGCFIKDDRREVVWLLSIAPCEAHRKNPGAALVGVAYEGCKAAVDAGGQP